MYYIGICDDEKVFLDNIVEMTKDILSEMKIEYKIFTFLNTENIEEYLNTSGASLDLLLLDILIGKQSGLAFAHKLRAEGNQLPVIFITNTRDYAPEGYKVDALGYLLKPVPRAELKDALLRAYHRHQNQTIVLRSPSHSVSFGINDVLYFDIHNKELEIHIADGSILHISASLNSLLSKLPKHQFVRCYRSYIVSLPAISSIWRYGIELKNHETIPVSRTYYSAVQNALLDWASL